MKHKVIVKTEMMICSRCCYEYPIEKMKHVDNAYYCPDCQDYHEGYLCEECYNL